MTGLPSKTDWIDKARTLSREQLAAYCAESMAINGVLVLHPEFATALRRHRPELWRLIEMGGDWFCD